MGYEVNMFLGSPRRFDNEERAWFQVFATVDLSKPYGDLADLAEAALGDPVYMYASDGNRKLVEDCYGKELMAVPAERVLTLMQKEAKRNKSDYGGNGYRRYNMAIPLLKAFIANFKEPYVVLYGH